MVEYETGASYQIIELNRANKTDYKERFYKFSKRLIDVLGSVVGLMITAPIITGIALVHLFDGDHGPVLFKQKRVGLNGKEFYIYKFRTMILDAEKKLKSNEELYQKYVQNGYKLDQSEDPRITKLGRFLRKTSLDELPQMINVFKGEMSLVGPRPIIDNELNEYADRKGYFLSVKPGLTGYWQVSGRSDVNYPERADLELFYVYNQGLLLDIKIILKTVIVVLQRKGAY